MEPSVAIRPYALDDVPHLFEAATESVADVHAWLPWCHPGYRVEEAREWIASRVAAFGAGEEYSFAVVSPEGRYLGGVGVNLIDRVHLRGNLGYWVRTSATGRGVASAAARIAARWIFEHTDLERLEIVAALANRASQRVAEKAGAVREGTLRSRLLVHGVRHDVAVYSLLRGEAG